VILLFTISSNIKSGNDLPHSKDRNPLNIINAGYSTANVHTGPKHHKHHGLAVYPLALKIYRQNIYCKPTRYKGALKNTFQILWKLNPFPPTFAVQFKKPSGIAGGSSKKIEQ